LKSRYRLLIAAFMLAAIAAAAPVRDTGGLPSARVYASSVQGESAQPSKPHETAAGREASGEPEGESHEEGWGPVIAKTVNFALLVGILVYFLRTPIAAYMAGRIAKVREDLVTAAQTRETASRQLAEIDAKLKALPAELEELKRRGAEDLAAERVRIEQAAEAERQRLLEHTRREIDMRFRVAKRQLLELTADLAVGVASERIARAITPDDQVRMIDRYAAQVTDASGREVRQ
jgi:F-type H+-transporting ATPase subunit b